MKIAIIGAGAMASLYGVYLSRTGEEVYLVDICKENVDRISKNGLIIEEKGREVKAYPKAVISAEKVGLVDLVIVFVKSRMTKEAIKRNIALFGTDTLVISFQRGYVDIEQIEKCIKKDSIIAEITDYVAIMTHLGKVRHIRTGSTHIGWVGCNKAHRIAVVSETLNKAGFSTIISNNIMELVWTRLVVNIGINALTAITETKNGELLNKEDTKTVVTIAIEEALDIAAAKAIEFNRDETIEGVINIVLNTSVNKSSFSQSILNRGKFEMDTATGAIIQEGKKYCIQTPVNQVIYNLIKGKEKRYKMF